jgi:hypothetical protein
MNLVEQGATCGKELRQLDAQGGRVERKRRENLLFSFLLRCI